MWIAFRRIPLVTVTVLFLFPITRADSVDFGTFAKTNNTSVPVTQIVNHSLGETPKLVILWTGNASDGFQDDLHFGFGASDGTNEYSVSAYSQNNVTTLNGSRRIANKAITQVDPNEATRFEADLTSWNSTTFTLSWTTNDATTFNVHYIAIGGTGISAHVSSWTAPTSTGNHSETGIGFQPDVVLTAGVGALTSSPSSSSANGGFTLGAMDASGDEWAIASFLDDGVSPSATSRLQLTDRCYAAVSSAATILMAASFVSMDADGFTMNFDTIFNAAQLMSISIAGVNAEAGSFNKITSGSSQSITTTLKDPELLLLASWQRTSSTSGQLEGAFGLGASDGTDEGCTGFFDEDDVNPTDNDRFDDSGKVFGILIDDTQTLSAAADLTSLDEEGFTLNWSTNDAVATQICYLVLVPFSSVRADVVDLEANAGRHGVNVTWKTESEIDNVGFHVYREEPGGTRTRLTPRPIPGSAVSANYSARLSSLRRYAWFDVHGHAGHRYWIEDRDLDGSVEHHGPALAGWRPDLAPTWTQATRIGLDRFSAPPSRTLPTPRFLDPPKIFPDRARLLAEREALKIHVDHEGWYRVTHDDWVAAGLPPSVSSSNLRLYRYGIQCAIQVDDQADGQFNVGDSIHFYGLGIDEIASQTAVYWLTAFVGSQAPLRIETLVRVPSRRSPQCVQAVVRDAEDSTYFAGLRNGEEDNFFGPLISEEPTIRRLNIPERSSSPRSPAWLTVRLQGIGAGGHEVAIRVNDRDLGVCEFFGSDSAECEFEIPFSAKTQLDVELTTSGSADWAFLDSLEVSYPRTFVAPPALWRGRSAEGARLAFQQAQPGTRVFDVTDPLRVVELAGTETTDPTGIGVELTTTLPLDPSPFAHERTWLLLPPNSVSQPARVGRNQPSSWASELRGAQFVIVAPRDWLDSLDPLATQRRREGVSTFLVAIEDLYDEFSAGSVSPDAVRDLMVESHRRWETEPRYLLLVGDTTYDPRQRLVGTPSSVLPTRLIDSARLETASDSWFGDLDLNGYVELAVGRLPFSSESEVRSYIARILQSTPCPRPGRALIVSDDDDSFSFGRMARDARLHLEDSSSVSLVDRNAAGVEESRRLIRRTLEAGADLVVYFGHGGTAGWGAENLLDTETVTEVDNWGPGPVVISASCLNGFFQHRQQQTLGESWLAAEHGARAVVSSTAFSNPQPQGRFTLALIQAMESGDFIRLGDAFRKAQRAADPNTIRTTVLLGDPTQLCRPSR